MKTRRHSKILELIQENRVDTQEELLRLLRSEGYDVTQATVSRDIKELRLVKILGADGRYQYATGKSESSDISAKFFSLFSDSVLSVEYACNIVVVKCISGMAQGICAAMDSVHWDGVVGTLAGDDTIFVAVRNESSAIGLVSEWNKLLTAK